MTSGEAKAPGLCSAVAEKIDWNAVFRIELALRPATEPVLDRSAFLMSQVAGKRLTYAQPTGKDVDALHRETAGAGGNGAVLAPRLT